MQFIMVGGFLGAGKTTTIARLARAYRARGQNVAVITNDQANDLVDTLSLRSQGFNVGEIPGSCFCGNLEELTSTVDRLAAVHTPDVVLVEPVGSCTDLVASVIRPLQRMHAGRFEVAPYGVLLKPSHGGKILRNDPHGGFSPQAAYIFRQQLEEADFVLLNRADELPGEVADELVQLMCEQYPTTPLLRVSAKTGLGFEALLEFLALRGEFGRRVLALDHEQYAAAEADLGWLNGSFLLRGEKAFDLDEFLVSLVSRLRDSLAATGAETAHLKLIGLWNGTYGVANLISSDSPAELSIPSRAFVPRLHLVVNARVATSPETLEAHVSRWLVATCENLGLEIVDRHIQSFRPGQLKPAAFPP